MDRNGPCISGQDEIFQSRNPCRHPDEGPPHTPASVDPYAGRIDAPCSQARRSPFCGFHAVLRDSPHLRFHLFVRYQVRKKPPRQWPELMALMVAVHRAPLHYLQGGIVELLIFDVRLFYFSIQVPSARPIPPCCLQALKGFWRASFMGKAPFSVAFRTASSVFRFHQVFRERSDDTPCSVQAPLSTSAK